MRKQPDYEFDLDLAPTPKGRPRFGNGRVFTPPKTKTATLEAGHLLANMFKGYPLKGPLKIEFVFELSRPKSVPEKKRKYPIVKPDIDNLVKLYCDAMNGIVYEDDTQICSLVASKYYKSSGHIKIKVWKLK